MIRLIISNLFTQISSRLDQDEEGQTLVEYGLLLALIAIVVIAALIVLGPLISTTFSEVSDEL